MTDARDELREALEKWHDEAGPNYLAHEVRLSRAIDAVLAQKPSHSMDEQIDKLRAELALARKVLKEHEWDDGPLAQPHMHTCMQCCNTRRKGHETDCEWRRAMGEP